jgi:hypothetical protein
MFFPSGNGGKKMKIAKTSLLILCFFALLLSETQLIKAAAPAHAKMDRIWAMDLYDYNNIPLYDVYPGGQQAYCHVNGYYLGFNFKVKNDGGTAGTLYCKVIDDTGAVKSDMTLAINPGSIGTFAPRMDMPARTYTLTAYIGHVLADGTRVQDEARSFSINPLYILYNIAPVCDNAKFQNTGNTIVNFYVEMPATRSYAWIYVTGQSYGDGYSRLFELYVNDRLVSGQQYPYDHFTYSWNVLSYLVTGSNKIGIKLTTYTYQPTYDQYWLVSSWINVKYTASQHITNSKSWFAPYYKFRNTQWSVVNFGASCPRGLTSGWVEVSGTSFGDQSRRLLKVYIDGQEITPSGGVNVGSPFTWRSPDVINLLYFKKSVTIGIVLTTWESPAGAHWRVSAALDTKSRYEVWGDTDSKWQWNITAVSSGGASLYDTKSSDHENQFLGPTSFEIKSKEHVSYPRFYAGIMTHVPEVCEDAYDVPWWVGWNWGIFATHEIHLSITDPSGNPIPNYYYSSIEGFASPNNDGADITEIGSDMLKILSLIANGLQHPEFGVPLGIASVLIKYQPKSFEYGRETNGVYLKDLRKINRDLSDVLAFTVDYPGSGYYTINIRYVVYIWHWFKPLLGNDVWYTVAEHTFSYSTSYYYGP